MLRRLFTLLGRADRLNESPAPKRPYSDDELLRGVDDFNAAAESYWRAVVADPAGRAHALNKPFGTTLDTPGTFYRLGLLLAELDLGVGQTVLDFGAGSCWLSSCLNRLLCRTISVDISATALRLGEELFRSEPRVRMEFEPVFLPYDGHHIDLPDASVDRIVCYDAFHHVPNQDEVLREMYRVLRRGGRAVFAEPGEGHATASTSVFEVTKTGVLENELDIQDLAARAHRAGFDPMRIKPYPDNTLSLSLADYVRVRGGDWSAYPRSRHQRDLCRFHVFLLSKGNTPPTSCNPRQLRASLDVPLDERQLVGPAGARRSFLLRVANVGDTRWLATPSLMGGHVSIGGHLLRRDRSVLRRSYLRCPLPHDVPPGGLAELTVDADLPAALGQYILQLDLVDEHVTWFEQVGSTTLELAVTVDSYPDSRTPHWLSATLALAMAPPREPVMPGGQLRFQVELTNTGDTAWCHDCAAPGRVALGIALLTTEGGLLNRDYGRVALTHAVLPGETVTVEAHCSAPPIPGAAVLRMDLVAEGICWFEQHGTKPLDIPLVVSAGTPDSRCPGLLKALVEPRAVEALAVSPGARVELVVRVTNVGNTVWLSRTEGRSGQVALGAHLLEGDERTLAYDYFRALLDADIAPQSAADVHCSFHAPSASGRYRLILDMVAEGITWFADRGSQPAVVDLDVHAAAE